MLSLNLQLYSLVPRHPDKLRQIHSGGGGEENIRDTGSIHLRPFAIAGPTTGTLSTCAEMLLNIDIKWFFSISISFKVPLAGSSADFHTIKKKKKKKKKKTGI
jgi:hypothetical protein